MWRKLFGGEKTDSADDAAELHSSGLALNRASMPRHVAIVMDGNGRWAKAQGKSRSTGHEAGARTLKRIVRAASEMGVEVLTVYAFSTENWKRPQREVDFLLRLFDSFLEKEITEMHEQDVRMRFIGRRDRFTERFLHRMEDAEARTANNTGIHFNLAANYGSTSGDLRLSNFLLWQSAYAELYFTDTNWPDFTPEELAAAIEDFTGRNRRFGGLSEG